jgi:hypothetical protein
VKTPHLCWVHEPPSAFAALVSRGRQRNLRVGWLQLGPFAPLPELTPAAAAGMARSVAVGAGASVALKPIAGPPVLRDVLREHFLGFRLVLLSGDPAAPGVRIDGGLKTYRLWRCRSASPVTGEGGEGEGDGSIAVWKLVSPNGDGRTLTADQLLDRLARPRLDRSV